MENPEEHLWIDGNLDRLALFRPVHDRGNTALRAEPPRFVLPAPTTFFSL
jgi:hypothetical protein